MNRLIPLWLLLCAAPICWGEDDPAAAKEQQPKYPINLAVDGEVIYIVDLDVPGVWKVEGEDRTLFVRGSKRLREPLNRPRCIAMHPGGGILVGDSATREIYHIANAGSDPQPLCGGRIGVPMTLAVAPDGETIFVGDAEMRSVWRLSIDGGVPEQVVSLNARGLAFDPAGTLWAVTPNEDAIHRIDIENKASEAVVMGRPYQYPNGLTWLGDQGLVTDGYGKSIWKFTADGKTELWHEGEPLVGPVGIVATEASVWIADPKQRQVFQMDPSDKSVQTRL